MFEYSRSLINGHLKVLALEEVQFTASQAETLRFSVKVLGNFLFGHCGIAHNLPQVLLNGRLCVSVQLGCWILLGRLLQQSVGEESAGQYGVKPTLKQLFGGEYCL
ncbi:hypothetical protein TYRP_004920 [Tyrophagus putrescentiae]|nr:hypothetical protein TYRP_004920 [Tyrophagus putrescentiae]